MFQLQLEIHLTSDRDLERLLRQLREWYSGTDRHTQMRMALLGHIRSRSNLTALLNRVGLQHIIIEDTLKYDKDEQVH